MTVEELKKLKPSDQNFIMIATEASGSGEIMFAIPIPGETDLDYAEQDGTAYILNPIEEWMEAWDRYVERLQAAAASGGCQNRSRRRAEKEGAVTDMPDRLALPTLKMYQNSLTLIDDSVAHLQPIEKALADSLRFEEGVARIEARDASTKGMAQWGNGHHEALSKFDIPLLIALYTIFKDDFEKMYPTMEVAVAAVKEPQYLNRGIGIYLPDFLRMLGYVGNISKDQQMAVIDKITCFEGVVGIVAERVGGRVYQSVYPVMHFMGYDAKTNIIHFSSPFFNILTAILKEKSIRTDRQGKTKLKSNGEPFTMPSHSYLVKSSIAKERNKSAIEIVCTVVTLIEQCGDNTPRIKVETIIGRCPRLKEAFENASSSNKSLVLRRAFSKAWKLLPEQTLLRETYKDIKLPDAEVIPLASELGTVLEFPHKGKVR